MLALDALIFSRYVGEVTAWAEQFAPDKPGRVADIGAGPGTYGLALARRFPDAELVAIDRLPVMLDRIRATAREQGLDDRLRVVQADLDAGWPAVTGVDVAWAASSMHHLTDPDRLLRELRPALNPGGLLAITEMSGMPYFLPDDLGLGRPGLEERCHEAVAGFGWNAYPDWQVNLERAGYEPVGRRTYAIEASSPAPAVQRYARAVLSGFRSVLADLLTAEDLDVLDRLLSPDGPESLTHRDLTARGERTVWAARRPRD